MKSLPGKTIQLLNRDASHFISAPLNLSIDSSFDKVIEDNHLDVVDKVERENLLIKLVRNRKNEYAQCTYKCPDENASIGEGLGFEFDKNVISSWSDVCPES